MIYSIIIENIANSDNQVKRFLSVSKTRTLKYALHDILIICTANKGALFPRQGKPIQARQYASSVPSSCVINWWNKNKTSKNKCLRWDKP